MTTRLGDRDVRRGKLLRSSSVISVFSLFSVLAGFAVNALVASRCGVGIEAEAFFVASTAPTLIYGLARASCTTILVPAFSRCAATSTKQELRRLLSVFITAGSVIGSFLCVAGMVAAPNIVRFLAPGSGLQVQALAAQLARVLFTSVFVTWTAAVIRAFLYSQHLFGVPSALEGLQKAIMASVFLVLWRATGIMGIAYGYVLGTVVQLIVAWSVVAARWGLSYCYLSLRLAPSDLRIVREMSFSLGGSLLGQGLTAIERMVTSFLPAGSIAALGYARTLVDVMVQVLLGSAPLALLPSLATGLASSSREEARQKLSTLLRFMSAISLPVAVYVLVLSRPLVSVLFQRGSFDEQATQLTAATLAVYSLSIMLAGHFRAVEFYLYAAVKARLVLLVFCVLVASTVVFDVGLCRVMGIQGIALGYALGMVISVFVGLLMIRPELPSSAWRRLLALNARVIAVSGVTLLTCATLSALLWTRVPLTGISRDVGMAGVVTAAYVVVLVTAVRILGVEELDSLFTAVAHWATRGRGV